MPESCEQLFNLFDSEFLTFRHYLFIDHKCRERHHVVGHDFVKVFLLDDLSVNAELFHCLLHGCVESLAA